MGVTIRIVSVLLSLAAMGLALSTPSARAITATVKEAGVFYSAKLVERAKANVAKDPWAADVQKGIVAASQPWMKMSDDELWSLMFGNTIKRAWMVWSDGYCPACKKSVPMYAWQADALNQPWKMRCPHCKELFPKNDFHKFYLSGLDEHGVFDPQRTDRTLLFNTEHPDPADPLHLFGVDDGEGYVEGEHRWRFIGAYLIYGQWKQAIVGGITRLANAYLVTGDRAYAHKAGVLLDRVADLYPTFDYLREGVLYDGRSQGKGYVTVWHDACGETRELALAYDQVFDMLHDDAELVTFLSEKAKRFKLDNLKSSFEDIRRNIEERVLLDAAQNRPKIESNYPQTDVTIIMIKTILGWPSNREEVYALLDPMLEKATAVDGVSGEKGLSGYAVGAPAVTAWLLGMYARLDPDVLQELFGRHPRLHQMYRFHLDTWCLGQYYPASGDCSAFGRKTERYLGGGFSRNPGISPSMYDFMWQMYQLTGDAAFVQLLYQGNGNSVEGLPYDLFAEDPASFQQDVSKVIAREGAAIKLGSVNKEQWHIGILRSGEGVNARALWLDYDAGGGHGHADGMNLGLFAKGLDLLPDFGYPPVNYGGWGAPRAVWYTMTAAHNTVVVDGQNQVRTAGRTTLWADGQQFHAIRASGPELIGGQQYERTAALVDLSDRDCYALDIFRVIGGTDHAKFLSSFFGQITPRGLSLNPTDDYGHDTQMRNFQRDSAPKPGWSADWKIEDRYKYLPDGAEVHLRYTDLSTDAQASTAEAWVQSGSLNSTEDAWIPRIMIRRQAAEAPLASTFVGIIEPYETTSNIAAIRRLPLQTVQGVTYPDAHVAAEVQLSTGGRDLLVAADAGNPLGLKPSLAANRVLVQPDWGLRLEGELCFIRRDAAGKVQRIALCKGRSAKVGEVWFKLKQGCDFLELIISDSRVTVVSGDANDIEAMMISGHSVKPE